jgi:hypothetical protein
LTDQCHVGTCVVNRHRRVGTCQARPTPGAACNDGDPCTVDTTCAADGTCGGGSPKCSHDACEQCAADGRCESFCPSGQTCDGHGNCVTPCVRDSDCPTGDRCGSNGLCVNRSCCNGVAECGPHTTFGTCCAGLNVVGWCCCDSHPGAGDGWAGCFDGGDPFGDPPLPRPCPSGVFARGGPSSAPNDQGICLTGGDALQNCPG